MVAPEPGDIVIRGTTAQGFELVDPLSARHIAGPFATFTVAAIAARAKGARVIWQQSIDHRGRSLGEPLRLSIATRSPHI